MKFFIIVPFLVCLTSCNPLFWQQEVKAAEIATEEVLEIEKTIDKDLQTPQIKEM